MISVADLQLSWWSVDVGKAPKFKDRFSAALQTNVQRAESFVAEGEKWVFMVFDVKTHKVQLPKMSNGCLGRVSPLASLSPLNLILALWKLTVLFSRSPARCSLKDKQSSLSDMHAPHEAERTSRCPAHTSVVCSRGPAQHRRGKGISSQGPQPEG